MVLFKRIRVESRAFFRVQLERFLEGSNFLLVRSLKRQLVLDTISSLRPIVPGHDLIRVGAPGDGGYLLPEDFDGVVACFSPGVDAVSEFEKDCVRRGIKVHMLDASVEGPAGDFEDGTFSFEKLFLGTSNSESTIRIDDWIRVKCPGEGDLILQMDIEGAEWEVLGSMTDETLLRFRHLVIEFHDMEFLWSKGSMHRHSILKRLTGTHHVVHVHANNCCGLYKREGIDIPRVIEISFLRKDRDFRNERTSLPHALDADNVPSKQSISLSSIWFE